MRAASFGIPFQPIPPAALAGSDIPRTAGMRKIVDPFSGEELWAVPRIAPDWLLMHAHEADEFGNVRVIGNTLYDGLMARAARQIAVVIVISTMLRTSTVVVIGIPEGSLPNRPTSSAVATTAAAIGRRTSCSLASAPAACGSLTLSGLS